VRNVWKNTFRRRIKTRNDIGECTKMCSEEFKKEVEKLQSRLKSGVKDKALYDFIEQIVKEEEQQFKGKKEEKR
jgi:hypothetical protein